MSYVDGYVLAIPKKNIKDYRAMAQMGGKLWRKHGALEYKECVGEDLKNSFGAPFGKAVKAKKGETVVFAFIVFKSRKHRDQVNKKVMEDPSMAESEWKDKLMPFDMKRMVYGGFDVLVDA